LAVNAASILINLGGNWVNAFGESFAFRQSHAAVTTRIGFHGCRRGAVWKKCSCEKFADAVC
jgi:hypothetical protein